MAGTGEYSLVSSSPWSTWRTLLLRTLLRNASVGNHHRQRGKLLNQSRPLRPGMINACARDQRQGTAFQLCTQSREDMVDSGPLKVLFEQ